MDDEVDDVVELADGSSTGEMYCVWQPRVQGILSCILKENGIQNTYCEPQLLTY